MGRHIGIGVVTAYHFDKNKLSREVNRFRFGDLIEDKVIRETLINQMFPDIYEFSESENYYTFSLRANITMSEYNNLIHEFSNLLEHKPSEFVDYYEEGSMSLDDAIALDKEQDTDYFQPFELMDYYGYCYPVTIESKRRCLSTSVEGIMLDVSCAKTVTEDDTWPYSFFTKLLRRCVKPHVLADSLLVFLTQ